MEKLKKKKWENDINSHFLQEDRQSAKAYLKTCSISLIITEMQIKTTMRYHLTPVIMAIIKKSTNNKCCTGSGEKGTLLHCWTGKPGMLQSMGSQRVRHDWVTELNWTCAVGENANWYSRYWRQYGKSLKKTAIKPPYNPAIPLLGLYPEERKIEKDIYTPMFIATLFIIARTWKQPRCPMTDEWIKKLWYIYTMEYYSAIKKNTSESVLMGWMNLEPIIHSEVIQKEKDKYHVLTHICGI